MLNLKTLPVTRDRSALRAALSCPSTRDPTHVFTGIGATETNESALLRSLMPADGILAVRPSLDGYSAHPITGAVPEYTYEVYTQWASMACSQLSRGRR
jgi:hypothetical protein